VGAGLTTGSLAGAREFTEAYAAAGGIRIPDIALRQYARARLRSEVLFSRTRWQALDGDDHAYHRAQVAAFHSL
jgi:hypothetical protein